MVEQDEPRDLAALVVPKQGVLQDAADPSEPYRLLDPAGAQVGPVAAFLSDLQACGRPASTQCSYGLALLGWFRFWWALDVRWDQGSRVDARDFCRWVQVAAKPLRAHWRATSAGAGVVAEPGTKAPAAGKASPVGSYAVATRAHPETVLRGFYEFHLQAGSGPMVNPFPLSRRGRGRPNEHRNPMVPFRREATGLFRPRVVGRIPRQVPDEMFNELFAALGSDRDRALVAFWVSTGARACELLGATVGDCDPGQQLITVIRKGSRAMQQLPASPDAFVWLRLYQARVQALVPAGRDQRLWWTLRRPFRGVELPRRLPDVHPRQRGLGSELDAARSAAHGGLPDGPGPGSATDRRAVDPRARPADDDPDLRLAAARG